MKLLSKGEGTWPEREKIMLVGIGELGGIVLEYLCRIPNICEIIIQRDVGSGNGIDVFTITKKGINHVIEQEISSEYKNKKASPRTSSFKD